MAGTRSVLDVRRRILLARADDMTASTRTRSALVLAPHPDDETLACGATIFLKRAAGSAVTVCVATDGRRSARARDLGADAVRMLRMKEFLEASRRLGIAQSDVRFLGYEDKRLAANLPGVIADVARLIADVTPDEVFIPSRIDAHPDHRALAVGALAACAAATPAPAVFAYPTWFWTPAAWVDFGVGRLRRAVQGRVRSLLATTWLEPRIVRCSQYLFAKQHALDAYADEFRMLDPRIVRDCLRTEELFFAVRAETRPAARQRIAESCIASW